MRTVIGNEGLIVRNLLYLKLKMVLQFIRKDNLRLPSTCRTIRRGVEGWWKLKFWFIIRWELWGDGWGRFYSGICLGSLGDA